MLPNAHTACSCTSSIGLDKSSMKTGTAPVSMTIRVCCDVPDAILVKAHAASNCKQGIEYDREKKNRERITLHTAQISPVMWCWYCFSRNRQILAQFLLEWHHRLADSDLSTGAYGIFGWPSVDLARNCCTNRRSFHYWLFLGTVNRYSHPFWAKRKCKLQFSMHFDRKPLTVMVFSVSLSIVGKLSTFLRLISCCSRFCFRNWMPSSSRRRRISVESSPTFL